MAFDVDDNGNITCIQGDSGKLILNGLPTDENYTVYFAIQDSKRNPIGGEISVSTNKSDTVTIVLAPSLTDLLTVPTKDDTATYYYGVKLCLEAEGTEDTLLMADGDIGSTNTITVYPKKVEGTV